MPITTKGKKLQAGLRAQYGKKKGDEVFLKMVNSGKADWAHEKRGKNQ